VTWGKLVAASLGGWLALTLPANARAEDAKAPSKIAIGFSNLVARIDSDRIGFAKPEYRVHVLEALRSAGFNAVGAENLVFNRDDAEKADLVLGGTVKELTCATVDDVRRCRIGIEWQLLDREQDRIVYRVLTRFADRHVPRTNPEAAGKSLTLGALRRLMARPYFKKLASAPGATLPHDDEFTPATFVGCQSDAYELPRDFERVADGTVMVKTSSGFGSGFFLGPDGLVLTAAHVVGSGNVQLRTHDGQSLKAWVVRISHRQDVALLSVGKASAPRPCLNLELTQQTPGSDIYAIGSPASEQLAFSLSRGIVSGNRTIDNITLLQTDTSLSPGNSGGAMIDKNGRVVGVVSRKIAGHAVEGLGFAIPIEAALSALKLLAAASTSSELLERPVDTSRPVASREFVDEPDAQVSLDPVGDRRRLEAADLKRREDEQWARTPVYLPLLRWGGATVATIGALVAINTSNDNQKDHTRAEYQDLRTKNDLAWIARGVGAGSFVMSFVLKPRLQPSLLPPTSEVSVLTGSGSVRVKVSF
jgi:S1-C subfamily serine protease